MLTTATGLTQTAEGQTSEAPRGKTFAISGSTGQPEVVLKGFPGPMIQSDKHGKYWAEVPVGWSGIVTPVKEGYDFDPPERKYDSVMESVAGQDHSAIQQSPGIDVPSGRIRVVPTSQANPKVFSVIADDMQVMLHILRKNLAKKPAAMAGVFPDYGDLLGRDQERLEGLYVQGYGVFLFTEVVLARSAPSEKKADEGQAGATPTDPVWEQARQEMGDQPAGGAVGTPYAYGPGAGPYGRMGGVTAGATLPTGWKPEELLKELIQTFRHASNIRHLDPNELITLSVIGRIPMPLYLGDQGIYGGTGMAPDPMAQPDMLRWLKETTFTLQARKADIDRFARGLLAEGEFRQKVKVLTY